MDLKSQNSDMPTKSVQVRKDIICGTCGKKETSKNFKRHCDTQHDGK
jgi:hypothetical protein